MNKMYGVYAAVAVVVVGLGAWMLLGTHDGSKAAMRTDEENAQVSAMGSGTMADIMARGGSWKCEVSYKGPTGDTKGMTYVAGGKVRGDFEATVPQIGKMQMHMISDAQNAYTWTSMMKTGFKMAITGQKPEENTASNTQDFYHQNYEYQCSPWNADMSLFALPTDITFNDMSAGAKASAGTTAAPTGPSCATCDMIPAGEARTQCRTALKCK